MMGKNWRQRMGIDGTKKARPLLEESLIGQGIVAFRLMQQVSKLYRGPR